MLLGVEQIDFVQDAQLGAIRYAKLLQNFVDLFVQLVVMRIGDVADVKNQCGFLHFFQRRAKGCEQALGQIADETDGVRNQDAAIRRKANGANRRVEGGEHARGNQYLGAAESVEQCGFAGIGVANQGDGAEGDGVARFPSQGALFAHFFDAGLNFADAIADAAAVGFEFLFDGAAHADASSASARSTRAATSALASEARHGCAAAGQARQKIVQLRQFYLQLAFAAACVAGKNVQNELRAIDDTAFSRRFNIALLHRRQVPVENDQRGLVRSCFRANLVQLAAADERRGISRLAYLVYRAGDFRAGAARQLH